MLDKVIKQFLAVGKEKELEFARALWENMGGEIELAPEYDDIHCHIDVYWNEYGIDVKAMKKTSRNDNQTNENIHWVELKNVNGKKGWVFGDCDYIAFETEDYWLLVTPKRIISLLEQKVTDFSIVSDSSLLYRYYQRVGREDIIVKVKTMDLLVIANKIFTK